MDNKLAATALSDRLREVEKQIGTIQPRVKAFVETDDGQLTFARTKERGWKISFDGRVIEECSLAEKVIAVSLLPKLLDAMEAARKKLDEDVITALSDLSKIQEQLPGIGNS